MDTQEMLNRLLTKMDANSKTMLAEMKADSKADKDEMMKKNGSQLGEGGRNPKGDAGQNGGRTEI
jgi:hypothetical protein